MNTWSSARRHGFRVLTLYVLLYALPFPFDLVPGPSFFARLYTEAWNAVIPWVGRVVLGIEREISLEPTGSGDTTALYVKLFMVLVLAVAGGAVWSLLARRQSYPRLAAWLVVYARYWLGIILLAYGIAKLFLLQFPAPDTFRLIQSYGDSSPMGLAWTFLGQSPLYQFFGGAVETAGGLLLLWRRTTTLGALVCMVAMANVVVLNFGYDIPVKQFSLHLLLASLALVALDGRRLLGMLLGQAVPAREVPPVLGGRDGLRVHRVVKFVFLAWVLSTLVLTYVQGWSAYGPAAPLPPLYGLYEVNSHARNGEPQLVLGSETPVWRHVSFGHYGLVGLWPVHGEPQRYMAEVDEDAGTIVLRQRDKPDEPQTLQYHSPLPDILVLTGHLDGAEQELVLHRVDEQAMLLPSRGFHWVNETPFNR